MAHRGIPRSTKKALYRDSGQAPRDLDNLASFGPTVQQLVSNNVVRFPGGKDFRRREAALNARRNLLPLMSASAIDEAAGIIDRRYEQAQPTTDAIAAKEERLEKMYNAEWLEQEDEDEQRIYLAKAREAIQTTSAFMYRMVLQVPWLVEFRPAPRSLEGLEDLWKSAKLQQALVNYYMDDLWQFRHTTLRDYIKVFLKFPSALIKVDYFESERDPDIRFTAKDRALQYIDPSAHNFEDAGWWIDKEFMERSLVEENFQRGHWTRPFDMPDAVPSLMGGSTSDSLLKRFFGANWNSSVSLEADQLVEVWHYYQAPAKGRPHLYAVKIGGVGGWPVRYGPNPFPYHGIPFCGDSFDPHEWQADGHSLMEMHAAIQEVTNTALNMRLDDWRQNLWNPYLIPEDLVTSTTLDDWKNRSKFVRMKKELIDFLMQNKMKMGDLVTSLSSNTRDSLQLYQDLGFLLGQEDRVGHTGDIFRGQMPKKVTTATETNEALTSNQGIFQPAFMSIMRTVGKCGGMAAAYLRDPDFFGEERIIMATGGRYGKIIKDWQYSNDGERATAITFDQMCADTRITAISGAEAVMARSFKAAVVNQVMAMIGQVDQMYPDLRDKIDFAPMILDLLRGVVTDMDAVERTPEQAQEAAQKRQQQADAALAKQVEVEGATADAKEQARGRREAQTIKTRVAADSMRDTTKIALESEASVHEMLQQFQADLSSQLAQIKAQGAEERKTLVVEIANQLRLEMEKAKHAAKDKGTGE